MTSAELFVLPRKTFEEARAEHVAMERLLLRRTLATLNAARGQMLALGRRSAVERFAAFIMEAASRSAMTAASDGADGVDLPLSRGQIADVLGLTIETVSRQFTCLRNAGVIAQSSGRAIVVVDRRALASRAETSGLPAST